MYVLVLFLSLSTTFDTSIISDNTVYWLIPTLYLVTLHFIRLRNPFRFALDPNVADEGKTRFFINDVGRHTWESVHEGGDGFAGANYGYPEREGKISTQANIVLVLSTAETSI